jgi:hypothetical protein
VGFYHALIRCGAVRFCQRNQYFSVASDALVEKLYKYFAAIILGSVKTLNLQDFISAVRILQQANLTDGAGDA